MEGREREGGRRGAGGMGEERGKNRGSMLLRKPLEPAPDLPATPTASLPQPPRPPPPPPARPR